MSAYRELPARRELAHLVACTWERRAPAGVDAEARVLPDGCVDLVWKEHAGLSVAGPDTAAFGSRVRAGSLVVGLRLRPGVAGQVLGLPMSELRDAHPRLEEIWGRQGHEIAERLDEADNAALKRSILEETLLARLPDLQPADPRVTGAVRSLGSPASRVGSLGGDLFVSERQLRRVFREAVGYGPKMLQRILRFQRFLARGAALATGEESLAGVAAELGYADQAHLTRECNQLSGLSPARLLSERFKTAPPGFATMAAWKSDLA